MNRHQLTCKGGKHEFVCRLRLLAGFLILLFLSIPVFHPVWGDPVWQEGKTLILVYASGGSLETDYSLISEDIGQMVAGAANTSPGTLEILVGYGGSEKPGWQGMKIANLSLLARDLTDRKLGDSTFSLASYPDADMGSADTLATFLLYARDRFRYDHQLLILIGHGEAYTGMLFDQNHGGDPLTLPEMVTALQKGGYNVDLIGFDTCLMGSLEVASRMAGYAQYMVASEESEPAEGWQYEEFISYLGQHPDANVTAYGQVLINGYMKNAASGKTLSLLDLNQAGVVTASLDRYSKNLLPLLNSAEGYSLLRSAFHSSQQFGLTGNGTLDPATMDLKDVALQTSSTDPLLAEPAQDLIDAISTMVLLSAHDDAVPGAHGLAILSPVQINSRFYQYYLDEARITPAWDRFMTRYLKMSDDSGNLTLSHYS